MYTLKINNTSIFKYVGIVSTVKFQNKTRIRIDLNNITSKKIFRESLQKNHSYTLHSTIIFTYFHMLGA